VILLDTNAAVWILQRHRRAEPLFRQREGLRLSPVSLLELQYLVEVGKITLADGACVGDVGNTRWWRLDNASSSPLFHAALDVDWTRDPFDRLLVAHALHRRWRLATGDRHLLAHLPPTNTLSL
jgi:PIN domain nuclease of toxin-antitoxin system